MAFKKLEDYNEERFGGVFLLRNDGDYKDVIFLYRGVDDVLIADTHYIKSSEYTGYVHCNGRGCPACGKNIRVQTKLFIPLYDVATGEVLFFDRSSRFEQQLMHDVILRYPNPSDIVFRITRKGAANDINTVYKIEPLGRNNIKTYETILAEKGLKNPDYYSQICREFTSDEMYKMLNQPEYGSNASSLGDYQATPRRATVPTPGNYTPADIPDYSAAMPDAGLPVVPDVGADDDNGEEGDVIF